MSGKPDGERSEPERPKKKKLKDYAFSGRKLLFLEMKFY
jgi:hypothetical protein